ncbi:LysE family translocator [Octadecabacter sp.]|nr:LysE family translocator [Octadecabacter sp.]
MIDPTPLILGAWLALATAAISPGPNLVAVASRALGSGRQSALVVALGLATGAFLWSFFTAVGLGALFKAYPMLLRILGMVGGGYLLWLGFKGWRAALTGKGGQIKPVQGAGLLTDFIHGLTVTATNPKVVLLWASLSTFVGPAIESWPVLILFTLGSAVIIFTIYGAYGLLFSTGSVRGVYDRFQRMSEAVFGTMFGMLGLFMIYRALIGSLS